MGANGELSHSQAVIPSHARTPLAKSKLAAVDKPKRTKKTLRFPGDDTEFYSNIWDDTPKRTAVSTRTRRVNGQKLIDISQVAYTLTKMDYKNEYIWETNTVEYCNIWDETLPLSIFSDYSSWGEEPDSLGVFVGSVAPTLGNIAECSSQASETETEMPVSELSHISEAHSDVPSSMNHFSSYAPPPTTRNGAPKSAPVAPPTTNGSRAVFSAYYRTGTESAQNWDARFLLSVHEPIRHALFVVDNFLEKDIANPSAAASMNEFFTWFRLHFVEFLKCQHSIKSSVLQPLLQVNYSASGTVAESYDAIYVMVDEILHQEASLVSPAKTHSRVERVEELQNNIRKLNLDIRNVLHIEEKMFGTALLATFTEHSFNRYVMPRVFRSIRPKRIMFPWMVERAKVWGGPKDAKAIRDQLSFTGRFLYDRVWHPYFVNHIAAAMKHLDSSVKGLPTEPEHEAWFGCLVQ
ncbi:TPA: hypothetical protein N0F65_011630 [Lagenidium giganteum]|uniref:Uncharacterized protein n=1 Tax=Lagenidium giganteum TaxID=4803 RepID=A0AAV2ZAE2_9STRA|nr:TPA: hypothetical protein N0F65_011630 [Lagenidium giganteum]